MKITLKQLPFDNVRGIYTIGGVKGRMPKSALYLAPDAADNFLKFLASKIVVSDVLRTAESSLQAVKSGRGAKMPGFSGHNYGYCIDIDVSTALTELKFTKQDLDDWMRVHGWYCHRQDHKREREEWHFSFLGEGVKITGASSSDELEAKISANYGAQFFLTAIEIQDKLKKLGFYGGDVDGKLGPRSQAAIAAFQRAWKLNEEGSGKLGRVGMRTLAFIASSREVVD